MAAGHLCDHVCLTLHFREIPVALQEATQANYARLMAFAFSILIDVLVVAFCCCWLFIYCPVTRNENPRAAASFFKLPKNKPVDTGL